MIWKITQRHNQKSRELNGHTTVVLRRKKVEKVDYKFQLLGVKKND